MDETRVGECDALGVFFFLLFAAIVARFATINTKWKVSEIPTCVRVHCAYKLATLSAHVGMEELVGGGVHRSGCTSGTHARQKFSVARDEGLNNAIPSLQPLSDAYIFYILNGVIAYSLKVNTNLFP